MTLTALKGNGITIDRQIYHAPNNPTFLTTALMDAAAEKVAFIGCVWHPTVKTGTINIRKIHFSSGTQTFDAASTLRVSLQNVDLATGSPYRPDGTQDQYFDYVGGVNTPTASAWNTTGALTADRAVDLSAISHNSSNSRWLAVVWEWHVFGGASNAMRIRCVTAGTTPPNAGLGGQTVLYTTSWATVSNSMPCVVLECDDGTYAYLDNCLPFSAIGSISLTTNAFDPSAAGLKFRLPVEVKIDGFNIFGNGASGCDPQFILYDSDGTTALRTVNIDSNTISQNTSSVGYQVRFEPVTLAANTYYRFVMVATTTTGFTLNYCNVNTASFLNCLQGGEDMHYTERSSVGVWTDTTTRSPLFKIYLSQIHDAGSASSIAMPVSGRICA